MPYWATNTVGAAQRHGHLTGGKGVPSFVGTVVGTLRAACRVLDPDHTLTSDVTSNQARGPDRVTKRQLLSTNGENLPRSLDTAGDSQLRNRVIQKASSGPVGHGLRKAMGTGWRQWSMKKEVSKEARSVCRWRVGRAMPGIACIVVASCRVIGSAARAP